MKKIKLSVLRDFLPLIERYSTIALLAYFALYFMGFKSEVVSLNTNIKNFVDRQNNVDLRIDNVNIGHGELKGNLKAHSIGQKRLRNDLTKVTDQLIKKEIITESRDKNLVEE